MVKNRKSQLEFIALMASLMSIVALTIDSLLPALGVIEKAINILNSNDSQLLITMIFLGLGIGQLISGPISDSIGRKRVIYFGILLYVAASLICTTAQSLETMILGRILQGIGLSAPRTVSMAIVRDSYKGDRMARIMSFVTVIFISVPIIAPTLGKLLMDNFGWQSIFYVQIIIAIAIVIWFALRQEETLKKANRIDFNGRLYSQGFKVFFQSRQATIYTFVLGIVSGSFFVFLSTAQKILGQQYGLEEIFPYLFATIALTIGASTFFNGLWVVKVGMRKMVKRSSISFTLVALSYILLFYDKGNPSIYVLMGFLMTQFLSIGFLFGNLTALSMEPLGKIAGIGAAINGFVSTVVGVSIAYYIGSHLNETALPLFFGFFITGLIAATAIAFFQKGVHR